MANLDWSQCPAVESVPGRLSGAWVFRDTRMPVSAVFENIEAGASIEEIIEQFDITREQIVAVLEFAARSLDAPPQLNACLDLDKHEAQIVDEPRDAGGFHPGHAAQMGADPTNPAPFSRAAHQPGPRPD